MGKLIRPSVLLHGSLVGVLLVAVVVWWVANRAFSTSEGPRFATIRGMRSVSIYTTLEIRGFKKSKGDTPNKIVCKKGRHLVEVVENNGEVSLVRVTVRPLFRTDGVAFAPEDANLYGLIAVTPYDGAKASVNQAWASTNFNKSGKRDDGLVTLETRASDNIRILIIRPSSRRMDS